MATSPNALAGSVVTLVVQSNGRAVPDTIPLISVKVDTAAADPSRAVLVMADGDVSEGDFPVSNADTFAPGAAVRISAGYDGRESVIFEGEVVKHGITSSGNGASLVIECQGPAVPPRGGGAPVLAVTWGVDLITFEAALDARIPISPRAHGDSARMTGAGHAPIRGRMTFQGSAEPRVGSTIEVAGVGQRFSGNVVVSGVHHRIAEGAWLTEVEFGLDQGTRPPAPSRSG